jgi:hypothetical protein
LTIRLFPFSKMSAGGSILIAGFVVGGPCTESLLVRADGPGLSQFSVTGVLAETVLGVYSGSTLIALNTGWGTNSNSALIASTAARVGAFALAPSSGDSAQIVDLTAGAYTIQVSGAGGTLRGSLRTFNRVVNSPNAENHDIAEPRRIRIWQKARERPCAGGGNDSQ